MIPIATVAPVDLEPAARPVLADRDAYQTTTCPLCLGALQSRRAGLWCSRCRGWLVEEIRQGALVYRLWQGSV